MEDFDEKFWLKESPLQELTDISMFLMKNMMDYQTQTIVKHSQMPY